MIIALMTLVTLFVRQSNACKGSIKITHLKEMNYIHRVHYVFMHACTVINACAHIAIV